ncbi:MAG TPA: tetratricopeptide repeat protein [Chloroflexota bacterium]|nr:tetratricopeptide repeat protein [Chloroflexota bacterium]
MSSEQTGVRLRNLPAQTTTLLGREHDVQAVRGLLLRDDVRLVTLTGPGGAGKTRLALQVAEEVVDRFDDGACFVELSPVSDVGLVVPTIARALGVQDVAGRPLLDILVGFLYGRRLLLILDNFEQLLAAARTVADLLRTCPELSVLVTSRAPLQIGGEHEFPVPPLALPGSAQPLTPDTISHYAAAALFVERAVAIKPDFAVTEANAPVIAEICARLDGLPLAIELAAARLRLLSPEAMLPRLGHALALLTGSRRDVPARQQTLRDTIGWSYDLLTPDEQALFRRLGVFVGGLTLGAGSWVTGHGGTDAPSPSPITHHPSPITLDALASLVEKSLLRSIGAPGAEPRVGMLETIREYALEQLVASGEYEQVRRRHAAYYLALAGHADGELAGAGQAAWLDRLETEHDNLRAVLSRSVEDGNVEAGLELGGRLWRFWWMRGYLTEGRQRLGALLAAQGDGWAPGTRTSVRGQALLGSGLLALWQGSYASARAALQESLAIGRACGDRRCTAYALAFLGRVARDQGDESTARTLGEQGVTLFRELGEPWGLAVALHFLGLALVRSDVGAARPLFEESAALFRGLGNGWDLAMPLRGLGLVAYRAGDTMAARALLEEGIARFRDRGDEWSEAMLTHDLAYVAQAERDLAGAAALFGVSLTIWHKLGNTRGVASGLAGLAGIAVRQGAPERAARLYGAADAARQAGGGVVEPTDRSVQDGSIAEARAALGEATYAAAWAAGRALPTRQMIAEALEPWERAPRMRSGQDGGDSLSRREREVAQLVARGFTNRQIAEALTITEGTAINHLTHILNKLGFRSRAQVAAWVAERGLTEVRPPLM